MSSACCAQCAEHLLRKFLDRVGPRRREEERLHSRAPDRQLRQTSEQPSGRASRTAQELDHMDLR
eukprot:6175183-Pleurochrysis_carterae.AAC.3